MQATRDALENFTRRYLQAWQTQPNKLPTSHELYGIPSPCMVKTLENEVCWQPQLPLANQHLDPVAEGMDLQLHPDIVAFYSHQLAGDMQGCYNGTAMQLLQVWNEEDLRRLQSNLIGHLVMQQRFKQPASLFIATTANESEAICVDNATGIVVLEGIGRKANREVLAGNLASFLLALQPEVTVKD